MYFDTKSYLKSTNNHTTKHTLKILDQLHHLRVQSDIVRRNY